MAGLELALITVQAIQGGVSSHFNYASRFDGVLFSIMGVAITGLWLGELFIAVRAFRHRFGTLRADLGHPTRPGRGAAGRSR